MNDAIQKGEGLQEIYNHVSMDIEPLIEAEAVVKKRSDVKGVTWVAQSKPQPSWDAETPAAGALTRPKSGGG